MQPKEAAAGTGATVTRYNTRRGADILRRPALDWS